MAILFVYRRKTVKQLLIRHPILNQKETLHLGFIGITRQLAIRHNKLIYLSSNICLSNKLSNLNRLLSIYSGFHQILCFWFQCKIKINDRVCVLITGLPIALSQDERLCVGTGRCQKCREKKKRNSRQHLVTFTKTYN